MVGGRLRDVVAHECSTVLSNSWRKKTKILFTGMCAWTFIDHTLRERSFNMTRGGKKILKLEA